MTSIVRGFIRRGAFAAIFCAAGCSLINAFDDVVPPESGGYAPAVVGDGGGDERSTADGPTMDAGSGAKGAIVLGAQVDDAGASFTSVLAVLDPANGHEIAKREPMVVSAIRYDGLRDLWFIFESTTSDFVPTAHDGVILHVRSLNLQTGAWTELSKMPVPVLQSFNAIGVVRDRIGYVAYADPEAGAATALELVTLDTTNPAAVTLLNRLPLDVTPIGALSSRSVTGPGGVVNLLYVDTPNCVSGTCPLQLLPVLIPNGALPLLDPPANVGTTPANARASFASLAVADRDLIVFPRVANDAAAPTTAALFDPRTHASEGVPVEFFVADSQLRPAAVSECTKTAFFVGTNTDLNLHAVPIATAGSVPTKISTGHSGQAVYFEPTSSTALAPFNQGAGHDFSAFRLGGTAAAPTLTLRVKPDWDPPPDLRPVLLGIREPVPIVCP